MRTLVAELSRLFFGNLKHSFRLGNSVELALPVVRRQFTGTQLLIIDETATG